MKAESKEFLDLSFENIYKHDGITSLYELYKQYTEFEVVDINHLKTSAKDFCEYLRNNTQNFLDCNNYSRSAFSKSIDSFERSIDVYFERYLNDVYRRFAKLVFEVSPNKEKESVLEVGAGRIPSSSIWLSQDVDKVKTIDTEFYLSKGCLLNLGVDSEEKFFDKNASVAGASFVVGRCPCSAIRHMVKKCAEANVPYLIKLCDCDIVAPKKYVVDFSSSWAGVLPDYDSNVKLYKDFAYNLDITNEQLDRLIQSYDSNPPSRARRVKVIRYYNKGEFIKEEEEPIC